MSPTEQKVALQIGMLSLQLANALAEIERLQAELEKVTPRPVEVKNGAEHAASH